MINFEEINGKLPEEATYSDDGELFYNQDHEMIRVAFFLPLVLCEVETVYEWGAEVLVRLICLFQDGTESEPFDLQQSELDNKNWPASNSRCLIDPECTKAKKIISHIIRFMIQSAPKVKEYHIARTGFHEIDGVKFYSLGDQILWNTGTEKKINIVLEPQSRRMVIDLERYPERKAFLGMTELMSLSLDAARVVFAHVISAITRAAFIAAGITPAAVLEVIAKSGSLKTTYIPFLSQLYNRDDDEIKPETRLNSSQRFIEELLYENCEFATVLDDLHTAESSTIKRKNEETKEEITRRIGDNTGRGHMEGGKAVQKKPRGTAIILGEYLSGIRSTVSRGLVVNLTAPDPTRFSRFQFEPLLVSTFYYYFLSWYIENYDNIRDALGEKLIEFRQADLGDVHKRIQMTKFCLFMSYMLFWKYSLDRGFVTAPEANDELHSFWDLLTGLVKAQDERFESSETENSKDVDYFELIRMWYKDGAFNLAEDIDQFKKHEHKYDGLIYQELLCLRSEKLMNKVLKICPIATLPNLRQALIVKEALVVDSEGKGKQIGKLRFYSIPIKKLK